MPNTLTANVELRDGTLNSFVEARIENRIAVVCRIAREKLTLYRNDDMIKRHGIYLLLGKKASTGRVIYVGKADKRLIYQRLDDHTRDELKNDWVEAVFVTTSDNSHGSTEYNYLEHRFHTLAKQSSGLIVRNKQTPSQGNPQKKRRGLEGFIEEVCLLLRMVGLPIFEEVADNPVASVKRTQIPSTSGVPAMAEFWRTYKNATAYARCLADGKFVVLADSHIVQDTTPSCPQKVFRQREAAVHDGALRDGRLIKDVAFRSPSAAAEFVCGTSMSGPQFWRDLRTNELLGACVR